MKVLFDIQNTRPKNADIHTWNEIWPIISTQDLDAENK